MIGLIYHKFDTCQVNPYGKQLLYKGKHNPPNKKRVFLMVTLIYAIFTCLPITYQLHNSSIFHLSKNTL